ncbi:MAG TPA: aspartyl/asparaginyl beta-hydroxylase domain-containing protein [Sphingomicrobium sp.]|nr:aspartyl/asparaginyl beta-hydroxylase domain-containing protein [Sphingomicrobium sp.]
MADVATLVSQADRATAAGDLKTAEDLLLEASEAAPEDFALFMKIAALQRGTGRPREALATVHRALSLKPLDFTALLLRASLLQRLDEPGAPQAWSHALAQKPDEELPHHLANVVAEAEARVEKWTAEREAKMASAMQQAEAVADPEERQRIQRFRTNVLRRTRPYHSEPTHFHFPGLAEREFFPRRLFPWIEALERETDAIAAEMQAVMAAERAELIPYVQYAEHLPLDQWRELNNNRDWTAIHLLKNGDTVAANAELCPRTTAVLAQCDQPSIRGGSPNAMFSLLAPGTRIPAHVGVNNARLVCHLPLVVPEGCWFRVGAETRFWKRGEAFVFDDTIEHEALNPSDQLRVVFIFDVWHPDLSAIEREAVKALIEADGVAGEGL